MARASATTSLKRFSSAAASKGTFFAAPRTSASQVAISIYGWLTNPLVEYYITELGSLYTGNATYKGSVSSDGHTYSTYEHQQVNQPSTEGTQTFEQYLDAWGGSGPGSNHTVTTANHFTHWKNLGMTVGSYNYQILGTEAYNGASGEVNATVW